jgi:hypothetical protein
MTIFFDTIEERRPDFNHETSNEETPYLQFNQGHLRRMETKTQSSQGKGNHNNPHPFKQTQKNLSIFPFCLTTVLNLPFPVQFPPGSPLHHSGRKIIILLIRDILIGGVPLMTQLFANRTSGELESCLIWVISSQ